MTKNGVLLINLGTPDHKDPKSVRRYLKEFLSDPRVVDLPRVARFLLLQLLFLRKRHQKSAQAYQKIWTKQGSPLLVHSLEIKEALSQLLGNDYQVELGMRYGKPSIASALASLSQCRSLILLPLFPQYSAAATGSAIEMALDGIKQQWNIPQIKVINDFYQDTGFIAAYAELVLQYTKEKQPDFILFSYHGLPERHINKSICMAACDHVHACPVVTDDNHYCYRAQCYMTTDLIVKRLGLDKSQYQTSFQSRLGKTPWIKPYTDILLPELIKQGIKHLAVVSPSFVADCLETLEEINIRTREQWLALGGTEFTYIPCINNSPTFIQALANITRK